MGCGEIVGCERQTFALAPLAAYHEMTRTLALHRAALPGALRQCAGVGSIPRLRALEPNLREQGEAGKPCTVILCDRDTGERARLGLFEITVEQRELGSHRVPRRLGEDLEMIERFGDITQPQIRIGTTIPGKRTRSVRRRQPQQIARNAAHFERIATCLRVPKSLPLQLETPVALGGTVLPNCRLGERRRVGDPSYATSYARHRLGSKTLKMASREATHLRELAVRPTPLEIGIENCSSQTHSVRLVIRQRAANDPF